MTSKVLVKLPAVPFTQGGKSPTEMVPLAGRKDGLIQVRQQNTTVDRTTQLEQNMKFLQDQHKVTLAALHQEVEILRQRNRELQFQLVFTKETCATNSPSSPEDNGCGFVKPKQGSPVCVNVTPLQVELLEKDLEDIKVSLQQAKSHNQQLTNIVEQQKKQLNTTEESKPRTVDVEVQVGIPMDKQAELVTRLEDAEAMVKQLHKENMEQQMKISNLKASSSNSGNHSRGGRSRDGNSSYYRGVPSTTGFESTTNKFPPLQTQSYWHRRLVSSSDHHKNGKSRYEKQEDIDASNTVLPQLHSAKSDNPGYESQFYRGRGYHNNHRDGNHRDGNNRKYRGQMSHRDRRDQDHRYNNRRDYKDRNSNDHQREFVDANKEARGSENSGRQ